MRSRTIKGLHKFVSGETGAAGIETGIMLALVVLLAVVVITGLGQTLRSTYTTLDTSMNTTIQ